MFNGAVPSANNARSMNNAPTLTPVEKRFEFGANWLRFLKVLDDERIAQAKSSLQAMLGMDSLAGKTFLDIGSGSGLFSLTARSLAAHVHSFDYDQVSRSEEHTSELQSRFDLVCRLLLEKKKKIKLKYNQSTQ